MKSNNTDNLISFLKASAQVRKNLYTDNGDDSINLSQPENKMELAICVCMYS